VPEGGSRVVEVHDEAGAISRDASYTLAANSLLAAAGGDNFSVPTRRITRQ
jgi:hypothetical protein